MPGRRTIALFLFVLTTMSGPARAQSEPMTPLKIKLPAAAYIGTPSDLSLGAEKPTAPSPTAFLAPPGVTNLALGKAVTSSDTNVPADTLAKITDGEKEAGDANQVLLHKGPQWVEIDLGSTNEIYAIAVWHAHDRPKVYHDVVVEVADDAAFSQNVRTLFNNDAENKDGRGAGSDREYLETNEGKIIEGKGVRARCVRLYSNGSTEAKYNQYTEVEVYGRPAP